MDRENFFGYESKSNFAGIPAGTLDTECLGDLITVYNPRSANKNTAVSRIWINHMSFQHCGDGCIDITRPVKNSAETFTLSFNTFKDTDKTMIVGTPYDNLSAHIEPENDPNNHHRKYPYRVSMYGNLFGYMQQSAIITNINASTVAAPILMTEKS